MYRRSISNTLRLLAVVLVLFVLYHTWLKPTYLAPPSPPSRTAQSLVLTTTPASDQFTVSPSAPEVPQVRLVDPGPAPNEKLGAIRDELEKGNAREVESRLRSLPANMLTKERTRRYVAALWNNLGVHQEKTSGIEVSVKAYKKAVSLDPTSAVAHLNLVQACWELRDPSLTSDFLQKVIRLTPEDTFPHLALADLLLEKGDVAAATRALNHVVERAQHDPALQSYAQRLTARIRHATQSDPRTLLMADRSHQPETQAPAAQHRTEVASAVRTNPAPPSSLQSEPGNRSHTEEATQPSPSQEAVHFSVKFVGRADEESWMRIRAILEYAYLDICQKFGHFPSRPIMVVLHTNEKFTDKTSSPEWSDTLFNATSGEIHLPIQQSLDDLASLSRVLRHEFVHAVLRDRMGDRLTAVPTWLVEGLAIHLADDPWPDLEEAKKKDFTVIPLVSLEGPWRNFSTDALPLTYLEAHAATQYFADRYSIFKIRQVMNELKTGRPLSAAMQSKLSLSYEQFQRQWVEHLNATLKSAQS